MGTAAGLYIQSWEQMIGVVGDIPELRTAESKRRTALIAALKTADQGTRGQQVYAVTWRGGTSGPWCRDTADRLNVLYGGIVDGVYGLTEETR